MDDLTAELQKFLQLLEEQTPLDTPGRDALIEKTALTWVSLRNTRQRLLRKKRG